MKYQRQNIKGRISQKQENYRKLKDKNHNNVTNRDNNIREGER